MKDKRLSQGLKPQNPSLQTQIKSSVEDFIQNLEEGIHDLSALEVNTMIVSQINGLKFNPYISYCLLYELPTEEKIQPDKAKRQLIGLRKRFVNVAQQSKLAIAELSTKNSDPEHTYRCNSNFKLPDPNNPDDNMKLSQMLEDKRFLRNLRKLNELRSLTAKQFGQDDQTIYDDIYAQTIIQIDGDVFNLFNKKIFDKEYNKDRDYLLKIHQDAVNNGQKNWQELLNLVFSLLSKVPEMFNDILKK